MNTRSVAMESIAEHDKRRARERMWKAVRECAEWLAVAVISGALGAAIAFPYALDMGKAQEKKRAEGIKQGFNCNRDTMRSCENALKDILPRRK